MYADLLRQHPGMRYVGLMRSYFGARGYYMSFLLDTVQLFLALTVYVVLSESFLRLILPGYSGGVYAIGFWLLGSLALFVRNKKEALEEFFALLGVLIIMLVIAILGIKGFVQSGIADQPFSYEFIFLPFGALLFSFSGRSVIPDLVSLTRGNRRVLKRSIIAGISIPLVLYLLFVVGVLGLSSEVSSDAVTGLLGQVYPSLLICIGVLGALTLWSSYVAIGENIRRTLAGDVGIPKYMAGLFVVMVPIILFAFGLQNFIVLIALIGGLLTATEWACVALMWRKSFKRDSIMRMPRMQNANAAKEAVIPAEAGIHLLLPRFSYPLFLGVLGVLSIAFVYTLVEFVF